MMRVARMTQPTRATEKSNLVGWDADWVDDKLAMVSNTALGMHVSVWCRLLQGCDEIPGRDGPFDHVEYGLPCVFVDH